MTKMAIPCNTPANKVESAAVKRKMPITAILREMSVGEERSFPIEMTGSVRAVASRLRLELAHLGCVYKVQPDKDTLAVSVTRIK